MQLAVNSWSYRRTLEDKTLDLPGLLDELPATGLTALEVAGAHFANRNDVYLAELRQRCIDLGITLVGIDLTNDFAWPDPTERERQTRDVITWMDLVAPLGVRLLHLRTGRPRPDVPPTRSQSWVRQCLARLLPEAEARDCTLVLDDECALFECPAKLIEEFGGATLKLADEAGKLGDARSHNVALVKAAFGDDRNDRHGLVEALAELSTTGCDGLVVLKYIGPGNPTEALADMAACVTDVL